MKKLFVILAVAAVTLVACKKEEVKFAEEQNQITFQPLTGIATKGAELDGNTLPAKGAANEYLLYAAASEAQNPKYFFDQQFVKISTNWQATTDGATASPIYWPVGGAKLDFLAFALPKGKYGTGAGQIKPAFDGTTSAKAFTVTDWDVYANEFELLYAAKNGLSSTPNPVAMTFEHALSLVMFNVNVGAAIESTVKINSITFDALVKQGSFVANNEKNNLVATWTPATAVDDVPFVITATGTASTVNTATGAIVNNTTDLKAQTTAAQLGETKLMIPQAAQNFTINYTIGSNTMDYYVNVPRQTWEAGKAYIYNITITLNEITIDPTVVDWDVVTPATAIALQ